MTIICLVVYDVNQVELWLVGIQGPYDIREHEKINRKRPQGGDKQHPTTGDEGP